MAETLGRCPRRWRHHGPGPRNAGVPAQNPTSEDKTSVRHRRALPLLPFERITSGYFFINKRKMVKLLFAGEQLENLQKYFDSFRLPMSILKLTKVAQR